MKVSDAMARTISTVSPTDSIERAAQLMKQEDSGFLPVCQDDRLIGVITDRDIVIRGIAGQADLRHAPVAQFMSAEAHSIQRDAELDDAARIMNEHEIRRLPVVEDGGRVVGVLSHGNLVQAMQSDGAADVATLGVTRGA